MSELYELPDGWEWKSLDEITELITKGTTPTTNGYKFQNSGINFLKIENIVKGEIDLSTIEMYISEEAHQSQKRSQLRENDVLFSIAGTIGDTAIVKKEHLPMNTNQAIALIRPKDILSSFFLRYSLTSIISQNTKDKQRGGAIKNISLGDIKELMYPLPPLKEQKRIVAKLDTLFKKIDKAIELHQQNIDGIDGFMASVLNEVFLELERKYEVVEVGKITNCIVPQRNKPKQFIGDIKWITTDDLILFSRISESSKGLGLRIEEIKESQSKIIPKESVIMSCVGYLGMVSIADVEMVVNQQLHTFQCSEILNNKYLMFALYVKRDYMYSIANITTVAYMNKSKCNSIPLPLPPLHIQQKVVKYLDEISENIEKLKALQIEKKESLKALKSSLLDRAFRGEL